MRFILNGVPHFFCAFVQYWIWYFGRLAVRNVSKWNSVHRLRPLVMKICLNTFGMKSILSWAVWAYHVFSDAGGW